MPVTAGQGSSNSFALAAAVLATSGFKSTSPNERSKQTLLTPTSRHTAAVVQSPPNGAVAAVTKSEGLGPRSLATTHSHTAARTPPAAGARAVSSQTRVAERSTSRTRTTRSLTHRPGEHQAYQLGGTTTDATRGRTMSTSRTRQNSHSPNISVATTARLASKSRLETSSPSNHYVLPGRGLSAQPRPPPERSVSRRPADMPTSSPSPSLRSNTSSTRRSSSSGTASITSLESRELITPSHVPAANISRPVASTTHLIVTQSSAASIKSVSPALSMSSINSLRVADHGQPVTTTHSRTADTRTVSDPQKTRKLEYLKSLSGVSSKSVEATQVLSPTPMRPVSKSMMTLERSDSSVSESTTQSPTDILVLPTCTISPSTPDQIKVRSTSCPPLPSKSPEPTALVLPRRRQMDSNRSFSTTLEYPVLRPGSSMSNLMSTTPSLPLLLRNKLFQGFTGKNRLRRNALRDNYNRVYLASRAPTSALSLPPTSTSLSLSSVEDSIQTSGTARRQPADLQPLHASLRTTMRKENKKMEFNADKPWKNLIVSGSMSISESKRYGALWAANRGTILPPELSNCVHGLVVRKIWERSRLNYEILEKIWNLVSRNKDSYLTQDEFMVGTWLIDQCLYGRKLPLNLPPEVWMGLQLGVRIWNTKHELKHPKRERRDHHYQHHTFR
ncbi:uncharacterized protein V1518DRAFT_457510 [Limtongia smithiae]|uniref:uncharacterized protein n=1 Tax=Limtongia smithiae TaxID=1125753 RepID=UPI0034CDF3E5